MTPAITRLIELRLVAVTIKFQIEGETNYLLTEPALTHYAAGPVVELDH